MDVNGANDMTSRIERRTSIGRESKDDGIVFGYRRGETMFGGEEDIISGILEAHNI
jgi:hypothetical protein